MKNKLWQIIAFGVLVFLTILFGILKSVWNGFAYFSLATIFLLFILYIINRILYLFNLKEEYDENLNLYLAELLNKGLITKTQFVERDERVIKGYYKQFHSAKNKQILILTGVLIVMISIIIVIFKL